MTDHLLTGGTERETMQDECQNPTCDRDAEETYTDEHDNELAVCGSCYWQLVTGKRPTGLGIEPVTGPPVLDPEWPDVEFDPPFEWTIPDVTVGDSG